MGANIPPSVEEQVLNILNSIEESLIKINGNLEIIAHKLQNSVVL